MEVGTSRRTRYRPGLAERGQRFLVASTAAVTSLFLIAGPSLAGAAAEAATPAAWSSITTVYYDPAEDDTADKYLKNAAEDLKAQLALAGKSVTVTAGSDPPSTPSIRLRANAALPEFAGRKPETFKLATDNSGVSITGKTPVAASHGSYAFLEKLGFAWLGNHPAWDVAPRALPALPELNEVSEPRFIQRQIAITAANFQFQGDVPSDVNGDPADIRDGLTHWNAWRQRNRTISDLRYPAPHSYMRFAPVANVEAADPSAVCTQVAGSHPMSSPSPVKTVRPDHPLVISGNGGSVMGAEKYALNEFLKPNPAQSVPISPQDGVMTGCSDWSTDAPNTQVVTDKVFSLASRIATLIKQKGETDPRYRNKYVSLQSYSTYSKIPSPSLALPENLQVNVLDSAIGNDGISFADRIKAFKAKRLLVGASVFYGVWQRGKDHIEPPGRLEFNLSKLREAHDANADMFVAEASDGWGRQGRLHWLSGKLMWDPTQNTDVLLDEYYAKAFGPAKEPMRRYYSRFDNQPHTDRAMGLAFRDLDEAMRLAANDPKVLERVGQAFLHTWYEYKFGEHVSDTIHGGGGYRFDNVEQAKALYSYLWRIKDLHILSFGRQEMSLRRHISGDSKTPGHYPGTDLTHLRNPTPPTAQEIENWLEEALSRWSGQDLVHAEVVNPLAYSYQPAEAASAEKPRIGGVNGHKGSFDMLIPSAGNETVNVKLLAYGTVEWISPSGVVLQREFLNTNNYCDLTGSTCNDSAAPLTRGYVATEPGNYRLRMVAKPLGPYNFEKAKGYVDVLGRMAGVSAAPSEAYAYKGHTRDTYFYVPEGTPDLVIAASTREAEPRTSTNCTGICGRLTRPDGTTVGFGTTTERYADWGTHNPQPGIWRLQLTTSTVEDSIPHTTHLLGVPSLFWHDAQYLMVPQATQPVDTAAPVANITSPVDGAEVSGTATITATATDNTKVSRVEFLVDGVRQGADTGSPYEFSWDTGSAATGLHTLRAKAFDAAGNVGTSAEVSVTVVPRDQGGAPPVVSPDPGGPVPVVRPDQGDALPVRHGYWIVSSQAQVRPFGDAGFLSGMQQSYNLNAPVLGSAAHPSGEGLWAVAQDGGIFSYGNAPFFGSTGGMVLNQPVLGMDATSSGNGYWLVASDGGIFSFGDAGFHGSTGGMRLNKPVVGMARTATGNGYWLVASDGGIFSFGDAGFHGSTGAMRLNSNIIGMVPTPSGHGYWLLASDGGIFSFGDTAFYGSTGGMRLGRPITDMETTRSGRGYWLLSADGGVFSFGDAGFHGSAAADLHGKAISITRLP